MPKGIYDRTKWRKARCGFQKGHITSNTTRRKISKKLRGQVPWNKDKKLPHLSGKNAGHWKGGRRKTSNGYIIVLKPKHPFPNYPDGCVYEHRLVIEKQIGRYLHRWEVSHHIAKRDDNRPKKLMAFNNHSAHKRFERGGEVQPEEIIFDGRNIKDDKDFAL